MNDAVLVGSAFINFIMLFVLLFLCRFIFSIGRIVRNQEKIIQILSGIAIKQNVDSNFLK